MAFFKKRHEMMFPPNKRRAFHEDRVNESGSEGETVPSLGNTQPEGNESQFQQLKNCFIASSYWLKNIYAKGPGAGKFDPHPALSFIYGYDKDIHLHSLRSWCDNIDSAWAKAVMAVGDYYCITMLAEILVAGNKGLQKTFLSTIKQMDWQSMPSIHESITATSVNIIQRSQDLAKKGDKNISVIITLIREARKYSASLLEELVFTSESPSRAMVQFYLMAGMIVSGKFENANIDSYIGGKNFTTKAAFDVLPRACRVSYRKNRKWHFQVAFVPPLDAPVSQPGSLRLAHIG